MADHPGLQLSAVFVPNRVLEGLDHDKARVMNGWLIGTLGISMWVTIMEEGKLWTRRMPTNRQLERYGPNLDRWNRVRL